MNIKDIEKDVLTKAENNLNPNTSSQLVQELQDKWGTRNAFDVTNKLQKQGYLTKCIFFMGGGFLLGYPTPAGGEYLKELRHLDKEDHTTIYQNNFNSTVSVGNLQQGHNNSITENKDQIDYSALLKIIEEINELRPLYMKAENYNPDFYKTLDELQEGAENKESYGKLKKIWGKLQSILESNSVSNISSIISTIISACSLFK
ncbi:hypothetical protein [Lactobacillus amylovorus]|uniref:hypothetical protein n=2 Tax=Lactobacillus amylovorus TaxID=1604 RepID=UPI00232F8F66|nr:hypothetical protein [Lactobacillus amylovorus]MDB6268917.1 hypothetical protein [Lactobacillus amylovorus]MDB6270045.1 hypothetical protein [Lactobacillus amylovorus]